VSFSKKHAYSATPAIKFREDAPEGLRYAVIQAAYSELNYTQIREVICLTIHEAPDVNNWSEIPNIRNEVHGIMTSLEWYRVYDVIEELVSYIEDRRGYDAVEGFAARVNGIFEDCGAGWQLVANEGVVLRGEADFENVLDDASTSLSEAAFDVAKRELREALADLSRRPEPDLTGAIHHALGALESTMRYIDGSEKDFNTLASKVGLPRPLDESLKKVWGFSSTFGRHVSPTNIPSENDARLIVHLSAAYCEFLTKESS